MNATEHYKKAMLFALLKAGSDGIRAVDLFTEVAAIIGEKIDPLLVCRELGYEPDDLLAIAAV